MKNNLLNLLSKKAQANLNDKNTTELLSPSFIETNEFLTKGDKEKLHIIRESYARYAIDEIKRNGRIASAFEVGKYLCKLIGSETQEKLLVILLNSKLEIIDVKNIFKGTLNSSVAHPREIFKEAVKHSAAKIIIAHNHPSGDTEPSTADIQFTKRMVECGNLMGIELLDHFIVGDSQYLSLREETSLFN